MDTVRYSRPNHNCKRLSGKVGIVTAATLGIGFGITHRLLEEGASLLICSRKQNNVDKAVNELRSKGFDVHGITCNVALLSDLEKLVNKAVELWGKIDILVSNAAVNPKAGMSLDMGDDIFDKIFNVNVKSYWQLVRLCHPHFNRNSSILFISSISAYNPQVPLGIYGVSKTAVIALAKALAQELGSDGIRVNVIAPGIIRTKFSRMLWDGKHGDKIAETLHIGRLGEPEDMGGAAAFLLSEDSAFMTGETIVLNGGQHTRL